MSLELYNTLTRRKENFEPINKGQVKFYSCGQTIYDDLHVGNARAYIVWDTLRRYLEYKGYEVRHVQNITDVGHLTDDGDQGEDKIEKRAKELGVEPMELVEDQLERYWNDTKALNIERQDIVPRATGHINEMINYIEKIIKNGYAYQRDGNVYFDVDSFVEDYGYGEMAKKELDDLKKEAKSRVEKDSKKKNQYDFALWLNADDSHLMKWDSPWGKGYPGWHIECSVMSQKYLGDKFDIHAGGKDHIFPRHPNEKAQGLAASGEELANYWIHNEFIQVDGEKMSKSKGNFYTIRELLEDGFNGNAIRLYLLSSHYRTETDFSKEGLKKAEKEIRKVKRTLKKIREIKGDKNTVEKERKQLINKFEEFMDDDLNTAKAKQELMKFINLLNSEMEERKNLDLRKAANTVKDLFGVLGIDLSYETDLSDDLMNIILDSREKAREKGDYEISDFIRSELRNKGFEIEDLEQGNIWVKNENS